MIRAASIDPVLRLLFPYQPRPGVHEPEFDFGWCHHCETFQRRQDAPVLVVPWLEGELHRCCVVCETDEPWEFGVFDREDGELSGDLVEACVRQAQGYSVDEALGR
jgi:hypothetical protein